jgi:2-keto-4-pentenoate hydratase/2-oxohepta-3-ene-1,7-dioic acid hydratase in catechol pathway
MKFFNFYVQKEIHLGAVQGEKTVDLTAAGKEMPQNTDEFIKGGSAVQTKAEELFAEAPAIEPLTIKYAPAVMNPEKILCVGLNYADHSAETHMELPQYPALFSKFSNALNAAGEDILLPKTAEQFDYEAELVIVIGKKARDITKEQAKNYIFGYTAGNDFSARDLQCRTTQWLLGKSPDGFAPIGPYIVSADAIDISALTVQSYVNGMLRQNGNTKNMIFDCATIVSYISQFMTLKPGDIIFTGTPAGVILGYPEDKRCWLKTGDEVTIKIEGIGDLKSTLK